MNNKLLTPEEVQRASEQFFSLFNIVRNRMPGNATTEDILKIMETVCNLAYELRAEGENPEFGFDKNETSFDTKTNDVG